MSNDPYRVVTWFYLALLVSIPIVIVLLLFLFINIVTAGTEHLKNSEIKRAYFSNSTDYYENLNSNK